MNELIVTELASRRRLGTLRLVDNRIVANPISLQVMLARFQGPNSTARSVMEEADGWSNGYIAIHRPNG